MPRILPERTVEVWTAAYVSRWHPHARFWAPTQNDPRKWDLSTALPTGRHFVFEYKAVEGYPEPYVPINQDQLAAYAALNDGLGRTLVWYVLPAWDVDVPVGQVLPWEATFRTIRAHDPRIEWRAGTHRPQPDRAQAVPSQRKEMALARGCEAFFYIADPERLRTDSRLHIFPGWGGHPGFRVEDVPSLAEGVTLEHFLSLVEAGQVGLEDWMLSDRPEQDRPRVRDRRSLPQHHATAISIQAKES